MAETALRWRWRRWRWRWWQWRGRGRHRGNLGGGGANEKSISAAPTAWGRPRCRTTFCWRAYDGGCEGGGSEGGGGGCVEARAAVRVAAVRVRGGGGSWRWRWRWWLRRRGRRGRAGTSLRRPTEPQVAEPQSAAWHRFINQQADEAMPRGGLLRRSATCISHRQATLSPAATAANHRQSRRGASSGEGPPLNANPSLTRP